MSYTVLVCDYYYRDRFGDQRVQRWIGNQCVYDETSDVVIVDWWNLKSVWMTLVKPPTALVKEGPKAIVKWREA
jgi:hypothetical protein